MVLMALKRRRHRREAAHFRIPPPVQPLPAIGPPRHMGMNQSGYVQCEAPKIAKLVYNSNNYGSWYL